MTRTRLLILSAIVAASAAGAGSQSHPDFSGRWTIEPEPAPATPASGAAAQPASGDMGSGWGSPLTITQDAKQITVEYTIYSRYDLQPPLRFTYALDGSESRNTLMLGRGAQVQTSRTRWDGQTLAITTVHTLADPTSGKPLAVEVQQKLTLDSPTALVVEVTRS